PGWAPANLRPADPPRYHPYAVVIYDPPAGRAASILASAALVAMIGATAAFLVAAPHLPLANGVGVFFALTATLWAIGALLDQRISVSEALYVFAAASTCAAYALDWPLVQDVMKPLAMGLLILSVAPRDGDRSVKRLVLGALAASLIGDALLLSPSLFLPGLVAFLAAHGFYIAAFSRGVGFLPSRAAVAAIAAFAALVLIFIWPGVAPGLKAPVAIYVGVIALMAGQAAGRAIRLRDAAATLVAAGALIFMASDMTIALAKFADAGWPADQWTLPTYYLAQGLIAFFVFRRGSAGARPV
ncbi:MAG TPA: lysoplasmalogenase, partial [Roseiarcus sp.]